MGKLQSMFDNNEEILKKVVRNQMPQKQQKGSQEELRQALGKKNSKLPRFFLQKKPVASTKSK